MFSDILQVTTHIYIFNKLILSKQANLSNLTPYKDISDKDLTDNLDDIITHFMNLKKDHLVNPQFINFMLLNSSFIDNLGLMHGKMGISIFFFHLARQTKNQIYEDYAGELIDEIYEEISLNTPFDFENGIAGIGCGIEYLAQNGFIEANTNEVLADFDNRIARAITHNDLKEVGLSSGLIGLGIYFLQRLKNQDSDDDNLQALTNKQNLILLIERIESKLTDTSKLLKEPDTFDINWDYTTLIWIFTEFYKSKIFDYKVESILCSLLEPIYRKEFTPRKDYNKLLLSIVIQELILFINEKSKQKIKEPTQFSPKQISLLRMKSLNFLNEIKRENLKKEVDINAIGILWLYKKIRQLFIDKDYANEIKYWKEQSQKYKIEISPEVKNVKQNTGNYNGIARTLLLEYI